jgi:hypothetical protein
MHFRFIDFPDRQGFVLTFASKEDRDYYVENDPAHGAFVKTLSPMEDAIVFDFEA